MALEIGAIGVLLLLFFADRLYRRLEPELWESWDALRRGEAPALEVIEAHLVDGLQLMLEAGRAAHAAHAGGDRAQPGQLLGALVAALDEWIGLMGRHLLAALAWWAVLRATVDVRPLPLSRTCLGELRAVARVERALFVVVPAALRVGLHARVLHFALRLMPSVFRTLEQPAPARPWRRLVEAVEDLDTLGHEALTTARKLRLSLAMPVGGVRPARGEEH